MLVYRPQYAPCEVPTARTCETRHDTTGATAGSRVSERAFKNAFFRVLDVVVLVVLHVRGGTRTKSTFAVRLLPQARHEFFQLFGGKLRKVDGRGALCLAALPLPLCWALGRALLGADAAGTTDPSPIPKVPAFPMCEDNLRSTVGMK